GRTVTVNSGATRLSVEPLADRSCATCWKAPAVAEASTAPADATGPEARSRPEIGPGANPGPDPDPARAASGLRLNASAVAAPRPAVLTEKSKRPPETPAKLSPVGSGAAALVIVWLRLRPPAPPSNSARWPSAVSPTTKSVKPLPVKLPANPVVGSRPPA